MRTAGIGSRTGAASGDVLIFLAILALGASILYPITRQRAFQQRVESATADVERLRAEALRLREAGGAWPEAAPLGVPFPGLDTAAVAMVREGYSLQWSRWLSAERVRPDTSSRPPPDDEDNPPPPVAIPAPRVSSTGGITVHSPETELLAALLDRYGAGASFIRDTTWTLILPRAGAPAGMGPPALSSPFGRRD